MNSAACPRPAKVGKDASLIETRGDLPLDFAILDEGPVDPAHRVDLLGGPRDKDHAIGLDALVFAARKFSFDIRTLVNKATAQSEPWRSALPEPQLDQSTLASKHLGR